METACVRRYGGWVFRVDDKVAQLRIEDRRSFSDLARRLAGAVP